MVKAVVSSCESFSVFFHWIIKHIWAAAWPLTSNQRYPEANCQLLQTRLRNPVWILKAWEFLRKLKHPTAMQRHTRNRISPLWTKRLQLCSYHNSHLINHFEMKYYHVLTYHLVRKKLAAFSKQNSVYLLFSALTGAGTLRKTLPERLFILLEGSGQYFSR